MLFPKPEKRKKQKRNREYDSEYLRWVHGFKCCICGSYPVHAHHVVTRGAMGGDRTAIPLCPEHHLRWVHGKGQRTTQEHFGVDFDQIVSEMNEAYDSGVKGPFHHLIP